MILVDTDVLIWYLKGNPVARGTINNLSGFCISVVTANIKHYKILKDVSLKVFKPIHS